MSRGDCILFALQSCERFGSEVARELGLELSDHEEREFEDGEHKARSLDNVRNRDAFILGALHGDDRQSVNDRLCRLLFFAASMKDAAADRVTVVAPYLCYARKDRQTKSHDPITTRYVAQLFEAMGVDRLVTMDVHNLAAFQNAFRIPTDHVQAVHLFARHFAEHVGHRELVVASPDVGGVKRSALFRQAIGCLLEREPDSAFMEKSRSGGEVRGDQLVGDVRGKVVILVDDLISSGGTLARAADACRRRGAVEVHAAATHGLFVKEAEPTLFDSALDRIVVTDTVPPFRLSESMRSSDRLTVLSTANLFAQAIRGIHEGNSLGPLREYPA